MDGTGVRVGAGVAVGGKGVRVGAGDVGMGLELQAASSATDTTRITGMVLITNSSGTQK
jgi:hypothetical protein